MTEKKPRISRPMLERLAAEKKVELFFDEETKIITLAMDGENYHRWHNRQVWDLIVSVKGEPDQPKQLSTYEVEAEYFTFSEALHLIKTGRKVKRKSWGGYWFIPRDLHLTDKVPGEWANVHRVKNIIMAQLIDGSYAPATPYQADLFADDWELAE